MFGNKQEEQHANTSANYDVELLHHRDAHLEFFKSGESIVEETSLLQDTRQYRLLVFWLLKKKKHKTVCFVNFFFYNFSTFFSCETFL